MNKEIFNDSYNIKPHISRIRKQTADGATYFDGFVWTEYGAVGIYSQSGKRFKSYSEFDFAVNGRVYVRKINKRYAQRGLIIQAKKFAKEMVAYFEKAN